MFPNLIIRGNNSNMFARKIVEKILGVSLQPRKEMMKSIDNFIFWRLSCGLEIDAQPQRNRRQQWWDGLLNKISTVAVVDESLGKVRIVIIQNAHLLSRQVQQLLRMHMETDQKTVRQVLTTREDQVMERSLESRAVILRPEETEQMRTVFPVLKNWTDVENGWLSDLPTVDIMEGMFREYCGCEQGALAQANQDLVLKDCYNEHTVLTLAWKWIQNHKKECQNCRKMKN